MDSSCHGSLTEVGSKSIFTRRMCWGPSSCSFFAPFVLEQAFFRHVSPPTRGVRLARPKKSSRALSTSPFPWFVAVHNLGCQLSSFPSTSRARGRRVLGTADAMKWFCHHTAHSPVQTFLLGAKFSKSFPGATGRSNGREVVRDEP